MKKTLGLLLIIPFAVAVLGFVNIAVLHNAIQVDISGINWDYGESEGFKVDKDSYKLEATPIVDPNYSLAPGNDLVWSAESVNEESSPVSIAKIGDDYYLTALEEGEARITCQNEKGNVRRTFNAVCYENGTVIINDEKWPSSGAMMGNLRKYGTQEFDNEGNLRPAKIQLSTAVLGVEAAPVVLQYSSNLAVDGNVITPLTGGEAYVRYGAEGLSEIYGEYRFYAVEDAINVDDYQDLISATNLAEEAYPVCLQRNLLSLRETYKADAEGNYIDELLSPNTRVFGNYDFATKSFSFEDEVYRFETTYNHEYLDQLQENDNSGEALDEVIAGVRLRDDLYGNGFSINMHELCYPKNGAVGDTGILTPGEGDLFDGPLYFVTVGPTELPFVAAYGQDNCGIYLDGDGILVDDLDVRNISDTDNFYDLTYVGSVIDVSGNDCTIRNSLIHNGRVAVRAFESENFLLENSYLYRAREFLLKVGSDTYLKTDPSKQVSYQSPLGNQSGSLSSILGGQDSPGDALWAEAVRYGNASHVSALRAIQEGLDNKADQGYLNMRVKDCTFSDSGLFSIAFDTVFNGAYLYNGTPASLFSLVEGIEGLVTIPDDVGGTSKPVSLSLEGDTRFYDFKSVASIDASCLIEQNLGQLIRPAPGIDDYFPMRKLLSEACNALRYNYYPDGPSGDPYINPIAGFYGGGYNASILRYDGLTKNPFGEEIEIDYAKELFSRDNGGTVANLLAHCVPLAAGMNSFRFLTSGTYEGKPDLYGENPNVGDLYTRGGEYDEMP